MSVGALVQKPLTTLMSLGGDVHPPRGPAPASGSAPPGSPTSRPTCRRSSATRASIPPGQSRRPASASTSCPRCCPARSTRRSARSGTTRARTSSAAGRHPKILRMEKLGVPTYDELIFRRPPQGPQRGASPRSCGASCAPPRGGHERLRAKPEARCRRAAEDRPRPRARPADRGGERHAARLLPGEPRQAVRLAGATGVERLRAVGCTSSKLLKRQPDAAAALTNEFLPGQGLNQGGTSEAP